MMLLSTENYDVESVITFYKNINFTIVDTLLLMLGIWSPTWNRETFTPGEKTYDGSCQTKSCTGSWVSLPILCVRDKYFLDTSVDATVEASETIDTE